MAVRPPSRVSPTAPDADIPLPPPETREAALEERLRALGIAFATHRHAPVFTVEEAQALRGDLPGTHTKNLFLQDRTGSLFLLTLREAFVVDLNALAKSLNRPRFSFAKAELLKAILQVPPGSVTPFALMNDTARIVTPVFDAEMMAMDPLYFHPLRNDRSTAIAGADLLRFARAIGHDPLLVTLPERPAGELKGS